MCCNFRNGAGRSGTFIAIYNSTERLKLEQLIDVLQCVRAIKAVVPNAVETPVSFIYTNLFTTKPLIKGQLSDCQKIKIDKSQDIYTDKVNLYFQLFPANITRKIYT